MFSSRTRFALVPNRLTTLLGEKRARGADVLDLTESNPTRAGFAYQAEAIRAALSDPRLIHYEPQPRGAPSARRAIADYYAARGLAVDPDDILLTSSTSEAYAFLFKLLGDPGQTVLVPAPSYPLFEFLATLESATVRHYPLEWEGRWRLDEAALAAACTDDVRAIVVVSPNNPTGSILAPDEVAALRRLERPLIADEVFADYAPAFHSLAGERERLTFVLSGLSKVCGLPQVKLGWMVVAGPDRERAAALDRLDLIADTYLSVATPVQLAAPRLFELAPALQAQIRARVAGNRAVLERALADSAAQVLPADGGWYAVVRLPRTRSEEDWTLELLEHDDVLVHPGYFFDFAQEAWIVASLLPPPERFAEAAARLRARVDA